MKDKKRQEIKAYADLILKNISTSNDLILHQFESRNPFQSKHDANIYDVIDYLTEKEYIRFYQGPESFIHNSDDGSWMEIGNHIERISITDSGVAIKEEGGIIKNENAIQRKKLLEKWKDYISLIGGITGLLAALFSTLIYFGIIPLNSQLNSTLKKIELLEKKIESIEYRQKQSEKKI